LGFKWHQFCAKHASQLVETIIFAESSWQFSFHMVIMIASDLKRSEHKCNKRFFLFLTFFLFFPRFLLKKRCQMQSMDMQKSDEKYS